MIKASPSLSLRLRTLFLSFHSNQSSSINSIFSTSTSPWLFRFDHLHQLLLLRTYKEESAQIAMNQSSGSRSKESSEFSQHTNRLADHILPHILNLYGSRATARDFEIYAKDATFEDPLMSAHGVKQIKSAFYSIPKVFKESSIVEYSVEENYDNSSGKHEILIDSKQHYKILGRDIEMVSLIKLDLEGGRVFRHEDRWDKKPLANRETVSLPLVGRFLEVARRGSMFATHVMMGFGKDPPPPTSTSS